MFLKYATGLEYLKATRMREKEGEAGKERDWETETDELKLS